MNPLFNGDPARLTSESGQNMPYVSLGGINSDGSELHDVSPESGRQSTPHKASVDLDRYYTKLESDWWVEESSKYASLVVPNGNGMAPIHRWFHLKEAFSRHLLSEVVRDAGLDVRKSLRLYDPFAGVGTSLLSAIDNCASGTIEHVDASGTEVNPFLHLVASTKISSAINPSVGIREAALKILGAAKEVSVSDDDLPSLTTFQQGKYFPPEYVRQVVQIRTAIGESDCNEQQSNLLNVCLGMTIGAAGRLRRDGRALRYEDRLPEAPYGNFISAANRIDVDMAAYAKRPVNATGQVWLESALHTSMPLCNGSYDLVLFSPPYPNNIDYTEVYKLELWGLGFIRSTEQFKSQRQQTLRSHPSIIFDRDYRYTELSGRQEIDELLAPILARISAHGRYSAQLNRTVRGYADDMLTVLRKSFALLRPGGKCVYVVGNSAHGAKEQQATVIAADILIARMAEIIGFTVDAVRVARRPPRRGTAGPFLRESVVFLEKK